MKVALLLGAALLVGAPARAARRKTRRKARAAAGWSTPAQRQARLEVRNGLDELAVGELSPAIRSFEKATKAHGDAASFFLLGWAHYQRGFAAGTPEQADKQDALDAVNSYLMALALDPKLSQVEKPYQLYQSLAMCYEALGANDKALDAYKKAFALDSSNPLLPLYAARLRLKTGDQDKAVANLTLALKKARQAREQAALERLVETSPLFAGILADPVMAGMVGAPTRPEPAPGQLVAMRDSVADNRGGGVSLGQLRDSVKDTVRISRAPVIRPEDRAVTDRIAFANDEFKFRRYRSAVDAYEDAVGLNTRSGTLSPGQLGFIYERIGAAYNKLGLAPEAIRALRKAVEALPLDSSAHYQLALAYSVTGHYQDSLKALKACFQSAPSTGELRRFMVQAKVDSELEPIRDLPAFASLVTDYSQRAHVAELPGDALPLR